MSRIERMLSPVFETGAGKRERALGRRAALRRSLDTLITVVTEVT